MKKIIFGLAFTVGSVLSVFACSDGGGEDYYYYNLFNQEITDAPEYSPFLMTIDYGLYEARTKYSKNENIEDWAKYLNISYDNSHYLVFESSKKSVDQLTKIGKSSDDKLAFANADFIKKNRQALLYLSYAKYLEPYMFHNTIEIEGAWDYEKGEKNPAQLDYDKVKNVLVKSWNAETDIDLKIRYAYQLVRFAHYTNRYKEAVSLFKKYVEVLNTKSVMYYYALDQKAGAERGLGNLIQANYDFFEVFSHTKNKKESAYISMNFTEDLDFNKLLKNAKTDQEKMDLYLLIGFKDFSNPLAAMRQIIKINPNADQAKILFARAINLIERTHLLMNFNEGEEAGKIPFFVSGGYMTPELSASFMNDVIQLGKAQAAVSKDADFWNLSVAYLTIINRDFVNSENFLSKVNSKTSNYLAQKDVIATFLELNKIEKITPEIEQNLIKKYGGLLNFELVYPKDYEYGEEIFTKEELAKSKMKELVKDILANRYFLQGNKAKAFLLHNSIEDFSNNVNWELLNDFERLNTKTNKTSFEKYLTENIYFDDYNPDTYRSVKKKSKFVLADFLSDYKGTLYLKEQKFDLAKIEFSKVSPKFYQESSKYYTDQNPNSFNGYSGITEGVFGYNIKECFECPEKDVIINPYSREFTFIKNQMNKLELSDVLMQLSNISKQMDERGVKANLLLSNFYYNTTGIGYFRELLSFDITNFNGPKFHDLLSKEDEIAEMSKNFKNYYKDYSWYAQFSSDFNISLKYAEAALKNVNNPELKTQILFAAAKAEQGKFYFYADKNLKKGNDWYLDYSEASIIQYKVKNFRTYFKQLKTMTNTKTYTSVKSNCAYFDAYVNM
jgi:hypothetical protein